MLKPLPYYRYGVVALQHSKAFGYNFYNFFTFSKF